MTNFRLTVVAAAVMVAAMTGCSTWGRRANAPASRPRPRSTATLGIVEPSPGTVITGTAVRVRLSLAGATIVLQTSDRLAPDEGHVHLKLDGRLISMTASLAQEIPVTKGPHILEAEFVANDHLPFKPRVITAVPFVGR